MTTPNDDPVAATAGEDDHTDPWAFAGEDAEAPTDLGRTDDTPDGPRDYAQLAADAQAGGEV